MQIRATYRSALRRRERLIIPSLSQLRPREKGSFFAQHFSLIELDGTIGHFQPPFFARPYWKAMSHNRSAGGNLALIATPGADRRFFVKVCAIADLFLADLAEAYERRRADELVVIQLEVPDCMADWKNAEVSVGAATMQSVEEAFPGRGIVASWEQGWSAHGAPLFVHVIDSLKRVLISVVVLHENDLRAKA